MATTTIMIIVVIDITEVHLHAFCECTTDFIMKC